MFSKQRLWSFLFLCLLSFAGRAEVLDNTQKISLIFVGPAKGLSESSFGHVALKLSPEKNGGLLDMVIEFVADVPRNENPLKKYVRGSGIGKKKYSVKADLSPFYDFRRIKTVTENRSLTVYDLKLSQVEIDKVVDFIQNYQDRDVGEAYLFLTKNCSYFAAHALEVATGKKINNKNFPWMIDDKLKKHGLITEETKYEDASSERMRLGRKFMEEGLGENLPSGWKDSFVSMLGERSITLRQSSYLKLLWIMNNAPEKDRKRAGALLRYLMPFENDVNQFTIKNLFRSPEKKKIIPLQLVRMENGELPKASTFKHELVIADNKPVIKVSWGGKDSASLKIPVPMINFSEDLELTYHNQNVGRYIRTKSNRWILSQRLDYGLDVNVTAGTVRTLLYIDLSENVKSLKASYNELKQNGVIALNNSFDFKGETGSCYALALLQKALLERAIFVPQITSDKSIDKIAVLKELFNGKYVIISGFKGIADFTSTIPKEDLKTLVRNLQASLQKDRFAQMKENILERELLDRVTEKRLKTMLDEGLFVPIVIGMSEKGKLRLASDYAHVVLLHDMKKIEEGYRLTAYDPNTGLNSLFVLNKNFRLEYPFYDKNYDYVPMIDRIDDEAMTIDHAVRSRAIDLQKIRDVLQKEAVLSLEVSEITKILP